MAEIAVQALNPEGTDLAFVEATETGDTFDNRNGSAIAYIKNDSDEPITVTIPGYGYCDLGFQHEEVVTVDDGKTKAIGPFHKRRHNDPLGQVHLSYSDATDVTVAVASI